MGARKKFLKRPEKISITSLAAKAEADGMYVVQSEQRGILYLYNDGEFAVVTAGKGMLLMSFAEVELIITELSEIKDDVKDLVRMERRS